MSLGCAASGHTAAPSSAQLQASSPSSCWACPPVEPQLLPPFRHMMAGGGWLLSFLLISSKISWSLMKSPACFAVVLCFLICSLSSARSVWTNCVRTAMTSTLSTICCLFVCSFLAELCSLSELLYLQLSLLDHLLLFFFQRNNVMWQSWHTHMWFILQNSSKSSSCFVHSLLRLNEHVPFYTV